MNDHPSQSPEPAPAERLRAALSRLHGRRIPVPAKVDDAVLRAAREHLATVVAQASCLCDGASGSRALADRQVVSPVPTWLAELREGLLRFVSARRRVAWGGIAAVVFGVGLLVWMDAHRLPTARSADLNGDGVVDMLDAFALARELQQGPVTQPQLDLNGDGVVDERDVQALAARAVRLEQGGRS